MKVKQERKEIVIANRMKRKRALKTHRLQYGAYLTFLGDNPEMATNNDKIYLKQKYAELATILNRMDVGPSHTADAWRKIFVDWKFQTRSKARKIRLNDTNDSHELLTLTDLEKHAMDTWGDVSVPSNSSFNKSSSLKHEITTDAVMYIVTDKEGNLIEEPQIENEIEVIPQEEHDAAMDAPSNSHHSTNRRCQQNKSEINIHVQNRRAHRLPPTKNASFKMGSSLREKRSITKSYKTQKLFIERQKVSALNRLADSTEKIRQMMSMFVSVCGEMAQRLGTDESIGS